MMIELIVKIILKHVSRDLDMGVPPLVLASR